ncbi:MAG: 5'-nucleotidase C-terminal domain-containing protein [Bacteriovoracaceae bacterium]
MKKSFKLSLLSLLVLFIGCSQEYSEPPYREVLLESRNIKNGSTTTGNLMADAIKEEHDLDIVFYPSNFIRSNEYGTVRPRMRDYEIEEVLNLFPRGSKDKFRLGTMRGSKIKKFIFERIQDVYSAELQVSGVRYDIQFQGGQPLIKNISLNKSSTLKDDEYYKVAISDYFYANFKTFPGYKYRNGLQGDFRRRINNEISARDSLRSYLKKLRRIPLLVERRATVKNHTKSYIGKKKISEIQGQSFLSPFMAHKVLTQGIVVAHGEVERYPGGYDIFIHTQSDDGNPKTSEGLHIFIENPKEFFELHNKPELGDLIQLKGIIFEQFSSRTGLSRTSLRNISSYQVLSKRNSLPKPVLIGKEGRPVPNKVASSYRGNVNKKTSLNLNDALDFWESLEGMRIKVKNPRIVGFRGGREELENDGPKGYLNLHFLADGHLGNPQDTKANGIIIDSKNNDFNPEIITIATNHLSKGVNIDALYSVGDMIEGEIIGVMSYEKNLFGDGHFNMIVPEEQGPLVNYAQNLVAEDRKKQEVTKLLSDENSLSIASYNVKNLAGFQDHKIALVAESISNRLKCPDILTLVEIQDFNGPDFSGTSSAEATLSKLLGELTCENYDYINIDPVNHNEGGQPGGNIRVAMMYNKSKVKFIYRNAENGTAEAKVMANGSLNNNPGRVFPHHKAFYRTRKSLVAEFEFKGKKVFVIGNHFNSKLGDSPNFGANQPVVKKSEEKRMLMAKKVNEFIRYIEKNSPDAHIVAVGDFNDYYDSQPMKQLENTVLDNLIYLLPKNERYTTNFQGNSQSLDYIFANKKLMERSPQFEILNFNSDYMGRISDHDPVLSLFQF